MDEIVLWLRSVLNLWRSLPLGTSERVVLKVLLVALAIYLVVLACELICRTRGKNYRSRGFLHDLTYWFYYRTGLHDFLFMATIVAALEAPLSFVALDLLTGLPFAAQAVIFVVVADFVTYWIHRAEHHYKFMWAFHTTHHSQEALTFATTARFHPVEMIYHNLLAYIPLRMLGVSPIAWLPLSLAIQLYMALQHTQISWTLGPFYKIFATPRFHAFHHSTDPRHHDRNFANIFSLWDYVFRTAVGDKEPRPSRMGLKDIRGDSLWGTVATPFKLLGSYYSKPVRPTSSGNP